MNRGCTRRPYSGPGRGADDQVDVAGRAPSAFEATGSVASPSSETVCRRSSTSTSATPAAGSVPGRLSTSGQVELAVDQRMPVPARVGQKHSDLAVLHPPRGARVLRLHPGRAHTLLQEAGVIKDQHCFRVAEMLDHVAAYVVADPVDVPVDALSDQRSPLVSDPSRLLAPHTHGRIGGHKQASMVVAVRVCS